MRALVVDDSAVMRKVLVGALARAGITDVSQASDGREAIDATAAESYDLVLMDWNMPNMLGIDAVREIRLQGRNMPIIMVTTEAERERVVEALDQGADTFIVKPFEAATILDKINEVMHV